MFDTAKVLFDGWPAMKAAGNGDVELCISKTCVDRFKGVRAYLFWPVARENLILLQSLWIFTNLIPTRDILYVVYVDKILSFYDVI